MNAPTPSSGSLRWLWSATLLALLGLTAANLLLGDLNQDEGWYLYAARQVQAGQQPYRDFAFTQGPVFPAVYGALYGVVRRFGVAGGRALTALFGLGAVALAGWIAARSVRAPAMRRAAAWMAVALAGVNVYQSYFTTVVKTYGLCALLLAAGVCALTFVRRARGGGWAALAGGALLALAAGTRLSAIFALPVAGCWLLDQRPRVVRATWLAFGLGALAGIYLVFVRPWLAAPEGVWFGLFEYHAGRELDSELQALALKAGFMSRVAQAYLAAALLALGLWIGPRRGAADVPAAPRTGTGPLLGGIVLLISLAHIAAPFPYDDYQAPVFPLAAAWLAVAWCDRWADRWSPRLAWGLLLALLVAAGASPLLQNWFVRGRDRIWWRFKEKPDLLYLRDVAAGLKKEFPGNDRLLTQYTYLAVECDWSVPPGFELGPFSFYPAMPANRARTLRVLNGAGLEKALAEAAAPVAAFSGYGLSIASPAVEELSAVAQARWRARLLERYEPRRVHPYFGQGHTPLEIFARRTPAAAGAAP